MSDTATLTTPTGILVTDAPPESDQWFEARRGGVTGTDLPKILGLTKYGNELSVWLDKRGELEDDAGEAAKWGQVLEDPVAQEWADRHGAQVSRVGVLRNAEQEWQRASLDRLVTHGSCPDGGFDCGLEIKTRSAFKSGQYRDDLPDDVSAQVLWGLLVTGLDHMHVAVLIGGQELRSFRVDRDEKVMAYLLGAAGPVWLAVLEGVPPIAHPDSEGVLLGLLNKVYAHRAGEREVDRDKALELADAYSVACDLAKSAEKAKMRAKTGLVQLLDDGDTGLVDGRVVFTYKRPDPGPTVKAADLRRMREARPEVYEALVSDDYITITNPGPRFDFKESK